MIISSELFGRAHQQSVINCAACCELLHLATLIHDDIIDEAETRRGQVTLNSRFGNEIAVIVGDYALAIVFRSLLSERDFRVMDMVLGTSQDLGMGEMQEILNRNNHRMSADEYFQVIKRKTGALFSLCSRLGAYLGGADQAAIDLASVYGLQLGIAFQIVDDLLDITADEQMTGKPSFNDIAEGRITLPMIHALSSNGQATGDLIRGVQENPTPERRLRVREHLIKTGSLQYTVEAAKNSLNEARRTAEQLVGFVTNKALLAGYAQLEQRVINAVPAIAATVNESA
ncbi:polyprenyl synthetase family protein [bacterium]|nr:polyprenyl synthetase family protein [bacterium]